MTKLRVTTEHHSMWAPQNKQNISENLKQYGQEFLYIWFNKNYETVMR